MADGSCAQSLPPVNMRSSVLEVLEPVNQTQDTPVQAEVVKNGKMFLDGIQTRAGSCTDDENQLLEEIDRLTGGDDDDDYEYMNNKFSQEAFDSFMRANDSDEDTGEISGPQIQEDKDMDDTDHQLLEYITFEYHSDSDMGQINDDDGYLYYNRKPINNNRQIDNNFTKSDYLYGGSLETRQSPENTRRRDSLDPDRFSSFDLDLNRLLSESLDTSWPYLPLYGQNNYRCSSHESDSMVSIITDLPGLLSDNKQECMKRVVPKILEVLVLADAEIQLAAAAVFQELLEKNLVTAEEFTQTFLQTLLASLDNSKEEVANSWLETLIKCIDLLSVDVVKNEVLLAAINKGQQCETVRAKLSCCHILAKVSSLLESLTMKNDVLPVVLSLCGDVESLVRACMCQRLDVVAQAVGLELTKSKLLPQLIELSEDESKLVTAACLETTANLMAMLDREANVSAIVPVVKVLLEKAWSCTDSMLPVASRLIGRFCHSLQEYMTADDNTYFLDYFKKLCSVSFIADENKEKNKEDICEDDMSASAFAELEVKRYAAYNMPAMTQFVTSGKFQSDLYSCFSQLCRDSHVQVQKTIAAGFHEVAGQLGGHVDLLFPELIHLLNSAEMEVLKVIIPKFEEIMSNLLSENVNPLTEDKAMAAQDVVSNLMAADSVVFNSPSWRTQEAMLQSMQVVHHLCHSEFIYNKVLPFLVDKIRTGRARPVKVAASMTTTILCKHLTSSSQSEEIINKIISELYHSHSCYQRSLFVDFACCYLQLNSQKAFKEHLFNYLLSMKSDPVAIVRLKVLSFFPCMKQTLEAVGDHNLCSAMETILHQLIELDKDVDVRQKAQKVLQQLASVGQKTNETEDNNQKQMELQASTHAQRRISSFYGFKKYPISQVPNNRNNFSPVKSAITGGEGIGKTHSQSDTKREITVSGDRSAIKETPVEKQRPACLIKSKSTTNIPSLIPRLEQRPGTPTRREPVRRIPILITHRAASTLALTASTHTPTVSNHAPTTLSRRSESPLPNRRSQSSLSCLQSMGEVSSNIRKGPTTVLPVSRTGSVGRTGSSRIAISVKDKSMTSQTKSCSSMVGTVSG